MQNRVPHINELIEQYKPKLVCINELNLQKYDSVTPKLFNQYVLEHDNLIKTDITSSTGILVHPDVKEKGFGSKRNFKCMAPDISTWKATIFYLCPI